VGIGAVHCARWSLWPPGTIKPFNASQRSARPHGKAQSAPAHSAACRDRERTVSSPSASVAEMVVRTMRRASWAGQGRPRCMVARLSHITQLVGHVLPSKDKD
jgi:hypothetical protein